MRALIAEGVGKKPGVAKVNYGESWRRKGNEGNGNKEADVRFLISIPPFPYSLIPSFPFLPHAVARRAWGALNAWLAVGFALALSSFGVFLGRFERWNSWDVFTDPGPMARQLADGLANPLDYPRALAVTAVFTVFLGSTYLVFYAFARLSDALGDESRSA